MRLAISTGGGDAPGLNAVIRAAVLAAVHRGWECFGIRRGFDSLLGGEPPIPLGPNEVRGITHLGGTILGTSNRGNPLKWRHQRPDGTWEERDRSEAARSRIKRTTSPASAWRFRDFLEKTRRPSTSTSKTPPDDWIKRTSAWG